MKQTLRSKVIDDVRPYIEDDGYIKRGSYPLVKNLIHTDVVRRAIDRAGPNRVLGTKPPEIHKSEKNLPRLSSVTLAQLRSGHCARLRNYQHRVGRSDSAICPGCDLEDQTVTHLFDCPARPTTLSVEDMWRNPCDVVDFLRSVPEFADLPRPQTPPPLQRRRQRPPPRPPDSPVFTPLTPPISPFPFAPPSPSSPSPPSSPVSLLSLSFSQF